MTYILQSGLVILAMLAVIYVVDVARERRRRKLAAAVAAVSERQPVTADDVVISLAQERVARACGWCTPRVPLSVAMPDDCSCGEPCGRSYCGALQRGAERGLA